MTTEKLQKVLANAGLGSRRQLEEWISAGRVSIDGKIAQLGERVTPDAKIRVDGRLIRVIPPQATRILLYHKPEGEICTRSDPENRPTVFDHLPMLRNQRWIQVGRLDFNTSGLLLFTNDGTLANRLMHPSQGMEREYAVRILGDVNPEILQTLTTGVTLEDGLAKFDDIQEVGGTGANRWYHVTLREGRNREVRRLWESQGLTVSRLARVRFGDVVLPRALKAGRWQEMTETEVNVFLDSLPEQSTKISDHSNQNASSTTKSHSKPQGSKPMTAKPPTTTRSRTEKSGVTAAPKRRITTTTSRDRHEESPAPKHRRVTATATGTENRHSRSSNSAYGERSDGNRRSEFRSNEPRAYEDRKPSSRNSAYGERSDGNRRSESRSNEPRAYEDRKASSRNSAYGERTDGNRRSEFRSNEPRAYEGRKASSRNSAYGERSDGNRRSEFRSNEPRAYEGRKATTRSGNHSASYDDYSNASRRSEGQRFLDETLKAKRPAPVRSQRPNQQGEYNNASRRSEGQRFLDQNSPRRSESRFERQPTDRKHTATRSPVNKPRGEVQDVVKGQLKPRKPKLDPK